MRKKKNNKEIFFFYVFFSLSVVNIIWINKILKKKINAKVVYLNELIFRFLEEKTKTCQIMCYKKGMYNTLCVSGVSNKYCSKVDCSF